MSYTPSSNSLALVMKQEIAAWVYDTACERFMFHFLNILNHKLTKLSSLFKLPQHCPGKAPKMKRLLDERRKMGWLTNVCMCYYLSFLMFTSVILIGTLKLICTIGNKARTINKHFFKLRQNSCHEKSVPGIFPNPGPKPGFNQAKQDL